MNPKDFDELKSIEEDLEGIDSLRNSADDVPSVNNLLTDEYGELIDEDILQDEDNSNPSSNLAQPNIQSHKQNTNLDQSWLKNSRLADNETDKEYQMFNIFLNSGGGRSIQYVAEITNLSINTIQKVAAKNKWQLRASDYDRHQLALKLKEAQGARHERHMLKLEAYRQQQESLGHQLSLNAARIAFLANSKLSQMLDREESIDIRELPSLLNTASKLAEVGKNLQGSALGVDQLLAAIEEAEVD